jgi:hypothetical protein
MNQAHFDRHLAECRAIPGQCLTAWRDPQRSAPVGERGQVDRDSASAAITSARIDAVERCVRSVESIVLRRGVS